MVGGKDDREGRARYLSQNRKRRASKIEEEAELRECFENLKKFRDCNSDFSTI